MALLRVALLNKDGVMVDEAARRLTFALTEKKRPASGDYGKK